MGICRRTGKYGFVCFLPPVIFMLLCCRVLVLDAGRILEYDTPHNLLQQKGAFSKMVAEAGIKR